VVFGQHLAPLHHQKAKAAASGRDRPEQAPSAGLVHQQPKEEVPGNFKVGLEKEQGNR